MLVTAFHWIVGFLLFITLFDCISICLGLGWFWIEKLKDVLAENRKKRMLYAILRHTTSDIRREHAKLYTAVTPRKILSREAKNIARLESAYSKVVTPANPPTTTPI